MVDRWTLRISVEAETENMTIERSERINEITQRLDPFKRFEPANKNTSSKIFTFLIRCSTTHHCNKYFCLSSFLSFCLKVHFLQQMNWALHTKDSKILSNKWNDPRPSVRSNWLCCSHGGFGTDWVTRESEREKKRKRLREKERELYVSVTGIWHSFSSLSLSFSFFFGNQ